VFIKDKLTYFLFLLCYNYFVTEVVTMMTNTANDILSTQANKGVLHGDGAECV
jgi:hypothetical protein